MEIASYIQKHQERLLDELVAFLKIESISADPTKKGEIEKAAHFLVDQMNRAGFENTEICQTKGYPIVYGEKILDSKLPTVLVYGHYDVQPPDPLALWTSPPFSPQIKDDKIFARGASDDKGQVYMHIKAAEMMIKNKELPCNIKMIIEGEEEVGSENLETFVKNNKQKLKNDVILISDTAFLSKETPSITVGLRGLTYIEIAVTGPSRDLHSGLYGGAVGNPINILCKLLATLHDDNQRINIPGFYDEVAVLNEKEKEAIRAIPFVQQTFNQSIGIPTEYGEKGYSTLERIGVRPTLDINGIWGGYTGEGAKTVIPSKAYAKISCRLVPNQSSEKISELLINYLQKMAPPCVKVQITKFHGGEPSLISTHSKGFVAASEAYRKVWGKNPIPTRDGGSIPIVTLFQKELKTDPIMMGFGLDQDAIHSPNENYSLVHYYKGIETIVAFYKEYAQ